MKGHTKVRGKVQLIQKGALQSHNNIIEKIDTKITRTVIKKREHDKRS